MDYSQLPDYLLGEAISDTLLIGPRTRIIVADAVNITMGISQQYVGVLYAGKNVSVPPVATTGPDIQLGPDEGLIIEQVGINVYETDNGGKIKLDNLELGDEFQAFPVALPAVTLPYTFYPTPNDTLSWSMLAPPRGWYIRATADAPGSFQVQINASYVITNTDAAATHTYQRSLNLVYRKIQGLRPLVPRVFTAMP